MVDIDYYGEVYYVQAKPCLCWMAVTPNHLGYHF